MVIPWEGEYIMRGIYLWTNLINGKKYVGKAEDIASRKRGYRNEVRRGSTRYFIRALREYGFEGFSFEVIEEVEESADILEREQYWIDYFNTQNKNLGYNILNAGETPGESFSQGSKNNRARLCEEEVLDIRTSIFQERQKPLSVYSYYKDKISWDAFCKAYRGQTWKHVDTSMIANLENRVERKGIKKAKLTVEDVLSIRNRASLGETVSNIFSDYSDICSRNTIKRVVDRETWKDI